MALWLLWWKMQKAESTVSTVPVIPFKITFAWMDRTMNNEFRIYTHRKFIYELWFSESREPIEATSPFIYYTHKYIIYTIKALLKQHKKNTHTNTLCRNTATTKNLKWFYEKTKKNAYKKLYKPHHILMF